MRNSNWGSFRPGRQTAPPYQNPGHAPLVYKAVNTSCSLSRYISIQVVRWRHMVDAIAGQFSVDDVIFVVIWRGDLGGICFRVWNNARVDEIGFWFFARVGIWVYVVVFVDVSLPRLLLERMNIILTAAAQTMLTFARELFFLQLYSTITVNTTAFGRKYYY